MGNLRKHIIGAAFTVAVTLVGVPAFAATYFSGSVSETSETVEVQGYSVPAVVRQIMSQKSWSSEAISGARLLIARQKSQITAAIAKLKNSGAAEIRVTYGKVGQIPINKYLPAKQRIRLFTLEGITDSGAKILKLGPFPTSVMEFGRFGVRLNSDSCRLQGWNLFVPSSWFAAECKVRVPTPVVYLRLELAGAVVMGEVQDLYNYRLSELRSIAESGAACTTTSTELVCPAWQRHYGITEPVLLRHDALIGGYEIRRAGDGGHWVFVELSPDVAQLAKTATYSSRERLIRFGSATKH